MPFFDFSDKVIRFYGNLIIAYISSGCLCLKFLISKVYTRIIKKDIKRFKVIINLYFLYRLLNIFSRYIIKEAYYVKTYSLIYKIKRSLTVKLYYV